MSKNIDIPDGWEVKKLGEIVLKSFYGTSEPTKKNGKYPVLKMANLDNGKIILSNIEFIDLTDEEYNRIRLIKNDILFNRTNSEELVGKIAIFDLDINCVVASYIVVFRINQNISLPLYINFLLNTYIYRNNIKQYISKGVSQCNINQNTLKKHLDILLPPLAEQKKIAEILSLWDKAIQHTKDLISYKEQYKKGLMQNLLTGKTRLNGYTCEWKIARFDNCFNHFGGKPLEKYMDNAGECKFISIGNYSTYGKYIDNGNRIILNNITKTKLLNKNDLVMVLNDKTADGKIIGACILIDKDNTYIYNQRSEKLICKSNILPLYSWFLLNSECIRKKIFSKSQGGTQIYINFSSIVDIKIFLPPLDEQKAIADILSSADKEIELLKKQLDLYTEQKKGLMQNLLTGKIRVKRK